MNYYRWSAWYAVQWALYGWTVRLCSSLVLTDIAALWLGCILAIIAVSMLLAFGVFLPDSHAVHSEGFQFVAASLPGQILFCSIVSLHSPVFFWGLVCGAMGTAVLSLAYCFLFPNGAIAAWKSFYVHSVVPLRAGVSIFLTRHKDSNIVD